MYRRAPRNALYQGDIVVVPALALERDPKVISGEKPEPKCRACGEPIRTCANVACGAQLPKPPRQIKTAAVSARLAAGEKPFEDGGGEVVAYLEPVYVMLTSHACEIDQQGQVSCLPVRFDLGSEFLAKVERGDVFTFMPLPAADRFPLGAVDLNAGMSISTWWLGKQKTFYSNMKGANENALIPFRETLEQRLASLDEDGLTRLYLALIRHPTHHRIERLPFEVKFEPDDPDRPDDEPVSRGWSLPTPELK